MTASSTAIKDENGRVCEASRIAADDPARAAETRGSPLRWLRDSLHRWFDSSSLDAKASEPGATKVDWVGVLPFVVIHLSCLSVFLVGWSWTSVGLAVAFYFLRMFCITGFYHRYFSHRSFRTSRAFQFVMAVLGASSIQRSPLWWAAHHREHHKHSDQADDPHSPKLLGFFRAHAGWFMTRSRFPTRREHVRDWLRFPELAFFDRFDIIVPIATGAVIWGLGSLLARFAPSLHVTGAQLFVWCFLLSTVAVYHVTFAINSLAHGHGSQRFDTGDDSRNNLLLALVTLGEGWHNNHHHYPAAARQGFYWWEIDVTYYLLLLLERVGLIWDLRPVPAHVLQRSRLDAPRGAIRHA
ncbi:MAG: acyl-CoA desaturase [Planctomycetota bacterium]|nr:acyl-CoA desaturase [Planctomycetota bacterium]